MELTKEEYIEIGDTLSSPAVIAQCEYSIGLATRDSSGLVAFGWSATRTDTMRAALEDLRGANLAFTQKYGQHVASGEALIEDTKSAKKWRARAMAIGTEALSGENLAQLEAVGGRTVGRPSRFAEQIRALAAIAENHKSEWIAYGADEAFFATGHTLAKSLTQAVAFRSTRRHGLTAEHDKLDELDGRLFMMLKSLNRCGRALHNSNDDAALASGYVLKILRHK